MVASSRLESCKDTIYHTHTHTTSHNYLFISLWKHMCVACQRWRRCSKGLNVNLRSLNEKKGREFNENSPWEVQHCTTIRQWGWTWLWAKGQQTQRVKILFKDQCTLTFTVRVAFTFGFSWNDSVKFNKPPLLDCATNAAVTKSSLRCHFNIEVDSGLHLK